ncbi:MAG: response regulator [Pseudanabaena sp. ELA607]
MDSYQKTVLIVQPSKHQAQVWQSALTSQGLSVILETSDVDLMIMLSQMKNSGLNLPDLILLDLAASKASPYVFCRWCRDNYPDLSVVLTNAGQKSISEPERDWAVYQGAQDLLPGFQRETLLTGVVDATNRVLEVMGLPPSRQDKLIQVLFAMTGNSNASSNSSVNSSLSTPSNSDNSGSTSGFAPTATQPTGSANYPSRAEPQKLPEENKPDDDTNKRQRRYRGSSY